MSVEKLIKIMAQTITDDYILVPKDSIPDGLGEAVELDFIDDIDQYDEAVDNFNLKYNMHYYEVFEQAAKLLHSIKGESE